MADLLSGFPADLLTGAISFLLTVMIFSYLLGDNPFFRIAIYIFIGTSAGFAAAITWHQVLWPRLIQPLMFGSLFQRLLAVIPLVLGILLLAKLIPRGARLGNPSMALLVGAGAAVLVGGAVLGTLIPQTEASLNLFNRAATGSTIEKYIEGGVIVLGTVATLLYFHFGARATTTGTGRGRVVDFFAWVGQIFIAITFGVIFAGTFTAALTALIERFFFLWNFVGSFF